ncbi:MAG: type IV pilus twitching motility protein PilT [Clostridiales bacterium]|nr:type IV pilus twitching motility protein PilT [Clostridiales bacterium]
MPEVSIGRLLDEARALGCSDLHFTVGIPPIVRQGGNLRRMSQYGDMTEVDILRVCEDMCNERQQKSIKDHIDTDFTYVSARGFRHRVNVYRQRGNTAMAIRLLRNDIPTLADLNLPPVLADFSLRPRGLVLVTGPTGSGKSTTLAAMIDHINLNKSSHIITIEDPIEYMHSHKRSMINQREVGQDVGGFALALRAALREDPDIILVGEMRDFETINAAVTAAETGHLVMSTLHTTDAASTIDRIIDVFPAHQQRQIRTQLASVLVGICTQTLCPTLDGLNRIACCEILNATDSIKAMIRDDKVHLINSAMQTGKQFGMRTLDNELAKLVKNRTISMEVALDKCINGQELKRFINMT